MILYVINLSLSQSDKKQSVLKRERERPSFMRACALCVLCI